MLNKILNFLKSVPVTIAGGVCLLASLILPRVLGEDLPLYLDPAWVAVIVSGIPLLHLALWRVVNNKGISKISSALLISVAMIAAILIGDLFAAGEVAFIMAIGEMLEDKTTARARKGLQKLIGLTPVTGRRLTAGGEETIPAEEIRVGDVLRILPGEAIPVDGEIIEGETSVDQSVMTGESLPVDKTVGDGVFCGTVNRFGSIDIRATKVGEDSSLQKLIRMVKEAEDKQAPMQRTADRWASWLVPVALLIALGAGLVKFLMGDPEYLTVAVTVLVVFCPCALVLATPTAIMAAIGQATRHGVIIKSGEALEKMGRVDTVAFDKTGTLTFGNLAVSDVLTFSDKTETELLTLTAAAESRSEHPLGRAISAHAGELGLDIPAVSDFRMEAGRGVSATVKGTSLLCGNRTYLESRGVEIPTAATEAMEGLRDQGKALVLVAEGKELQGVIALSDTLRPTAPEMVKKLRSMDTQTVLLTGDNRNAANHFAAQVGITEIRADLLPEDKVTAIATLQAEGKQVCMIGDGVNDAPALKTAEVGVAMGTMGSDIAIEAADIALMGDDISKIPYLKRLSRATLNTIRLSITLSLCINFVAIALSLLEVLTPTTGALVHNLGSCFVVLIAALLYDRKFED